MTDEHATTTTPQDQQTAPAQQPTGANDNFRNMAMAVWIAHLVGLVSSGLGGLVAVIIAYIQRNDARNSVYADHFTEGIKTFWWGLAWGVVAFAITIFSAGFLAFAFIIPAVYIIYKSVKGLMRVNEQRAFSA